MLVDAKLHAAVGNLVLLRRLTDRLEGRFDPGTATFVRMRPSTGTSPPAFAAPTGPSSGCGRTRHRGF